MTLRTVAIASPRAVWTQLTVVSVLTGLLAGCGDGGDEFDEDIGAATAWTQCSKEWSRCVFTGTRDVRYGTESSFVVKSFNNGVDCKNSSFGSDPAPGVTKTCWYASEVSAPPVPPPVPPAALCAAPALLDTSRPTTVVGSGTPASCSEAALRSAITKGGVITFSCGAAKTVIPVTQTIVVPVDRDTTIDGRDLITLDGRGLTQILSAYRADFRVNDRYLTLQRMTLIGGRDVGSGFVPRNGTRECAWGYKSGGGGAISARDMNVRILGSVFENNRGPELGPDVAGGAIYILGSKKLVIANSTFRNNSASNGGAIGALHTSTELFNVVLENNRALGLLANFAGAVGCPTFNHEEQGGAGGLGGAFYSDGFDPGDTFCGARMTGNSSGDLGGAVFRSAYWGLLSNVAKQTITWESSTFERNKSAAGGGGAAYVNNSLFTLKGCTFSANESVLDGGGLKITGVTVRADNLQFTGNKASWGGGVAHWGGGPEGIGSAINIRYASNTPNDAVGDFPR